MFPFYNNCPGLVPLSLTLSFSSSTVPAVMPFLVFLLWQHTLKGRLGGDHTRLVTDLGGDQHAKMSNYYVSEPQTISHFKNRILSF